MADAGQSNCAPAPIAVGARVAGALASTDCWSVARGAGYYADQFQFSATAGDRISILMDADAFGSLSAHVSLIGPNGAILQTSNSGGPGSEDGRVPTAAGLYTLPLTGTYTIDASTYFSGGTGSYVLSLSGTTPCSSTVITLGQRLEGALTPTDCWSVARGAGYSADQFQFSATAGNRISVLMDADAFGSLSAHVSLIGPNGAMLQTSNSGGPGSEDGRVPSAAGLYTLPLTGTYTIDASTYFSGRTGSYVLSLSGTTPCSSTGIRPGQRLEGALTPADCWSVARGAGYSADQFHFSATAGDRISVLMDADAFGTLSAHVSLIGPNGAMLQTSNSGGPGSEDARIPTSAGLYTLPLTGSYTIDASTYFSGRTGAYVISLTGDVSTPDSDNDGLPDDWETQFGLDPSSGTGTNGAGGDPDSDGLTNVQELERGTHPRGFFRRYLAEGALNAFFDVRLALLNVGFATAKLQLRFLQPGGGTSSRVESLETGRRRTLTRADLVNLSSPDFSTILESDQPIVLDRTLSWDSTGYGSHAETGVESAATTWFLAEGSTSGDFSLFYLLQNPGTAALTATIRYLRPLGLPPVERSYTLPAQSRTTIPVDAQGPELAATDVSAAITATGPIIVERAMYISRASQAFAAGHGSAGVVSPAVNWFLAEGATGPFFDLFILLANPNAQAAQVAVDYLLQDGSTFNKTYSVPANGRLTIWVDDEQIPAGSGLKPLENVAVSTTITATNGVPIIVERAMWWPGPAFGPNFWAEAHNSPGATSTGTLWALAEGEVGGTLGAETYILIANTSSAAGSARVTLYFEDGTSAQRVMYLRPRSRTNVNVSVDFPSAAGRRFGATIESVGDPPVQIVVERAMYTSPGAVIWAAGTNALAARLR